jgi:signal transduction histidine kinase
MKMETKVHTEIPRRPMMAREGLPGGGQPTAEYAKSLGHDLHTPLNVIIGLCQLLERDRTTSLSATQRDVIERIDRNARALLETSNRLLVSLRTGKFK